MSTFGRFVAFVSNAQGPVVTSSSQVFLSDSRSNAGPTLTLLSHDAAGNPGFGHSSAPSISADGRFVVFTSDASNLPGGGDANLRIYRADTSNPGAPLVLLGTPPSGTTSVRSISADGRFVIFFSSGFTMSVLDTCETTTGPVASCQTKTNLISVDSQGQPVQVVVSVTSDVGGFAISRDGHYALFMYEDANVVLHVALAATGF
jgi:Tol biopolymer transport system component